MNEGLQNEVIAKITAAFPEVRRGSVPLHEAEVIDDCGSDPERHSLQTCCTTDWRRDSTSLTDLPPKALQRPAGETRTTEELVRSCEPSDGPDNLSATLAADRAFRAAVAELGR